MWFAELVSLLSFPSFESMPMPTLAELQSNSPSAIHIRVAEGWTTTSEESIVTDVRGLMKPAQVVEEKLQLVLARRLSRVSERLKRLPR